VKIAFVAGGWHFPYTFYRRIGEAAKAIGADLFCVAHRSPELDCVVDEKAELETLRHSDPLAALDYEMYDSLTFPNIAGIEKCGWHYEFEENIIGDWGFLNQWLDREPAPLDRYDLIVFAHDDTYVRDAKALFDLLPTLPVECPMWTNGMYIGCPRNYARGSFEIFRADFIRSLGGRLPLGETGLSRVGMTDSPAPLEALQPWNALGEPLRKLMCEKGMNVGYLSPYYRVSKFVVEGERGYLHRKDGAVWSYIAGLKALGVTK